MRVPLEHYPGMSRFVLDWLRGDARATKFLPRSVWSDARPGASSAAAGGHRSTVASALIASNRRWGLFVKPQLEKWASGESVTIVAGQQTGFAGGPLYTLAKIATVLKMKRDLERAGTPVTVMFWLATEDHDFDEVAQLNVPVRTVSRDVSRQLDLLCVRASRSVESKVAVGGLPIPGPLVTELLALYELERPPWLREGITFGDSFAELVASIFDGEVVLVDSLLPELRRAGAGLFESIFKRWNDIEKTIGARSAELVASGYPPQVVPREGESYSLLFELDDHFERHLIDKPRNIDAPERISTSALTRPLLQDLVLQPDIFVGGPAEVSYYAQITPLHEMLGVTTPRVALRGHALVAPKRILRFIERYGIKPEELFTTPDELLAEREPEGVAKIRHEADAAKRQLIKHIETIGEIALPAEHALARAINRSIGHIEYHFGKLTERAIRGLVRKEKERYAAAKELLATLYPDGHVQDRVVAWFPYWLQYGRDLVEHMIEEIEPDAAAFGIIGL
ncbi:MAG TPA: bacillithiol biosynthesis BshC [Thermoanaerobaculia bacterium]|nr:bacillithiol biosynthesis BshC [Thermoanaerobaculia bacterium]